MVVAKRQGREKPAKIEQRKVKGRSEDRDGMGREEGGGFRMGSTCIPVMDSF